MSEKINFRQAIELLNRAHGIDPLKLGKDIYAVKTLRNGIYTGRLTQYGTPKQTLLDPKEVLREYGPKRKRAA